MSSSVVQWRAVRQPSGTVDTDLFELRPLRLSINRYLKQATADFYDDDGTKSDDYQRGQRVEFEVSTDGGANWTRIGAGMVQDFVERGLQATVTIEVVGYDEFLRRNQIDNRNYSSQTISTILNDIITTDTPINWVGGNVSLVNDKTITRTFEGTHVDRAIAQLLSESGDESFGVNDDFEFFAKQQEADRGPSIVDGDWLDYDLPTRGRRAVNRVTLFYGSGGSEAAVQVEDREAQNDLESQLGAPRNVIIRETVTYPNITSEDEAEAKAREILSNRGQIQTGQVVTTEHFDLDPNDVFRLQISEKNIDADYRVAAIEHWSGRNEAVVTVAEDQAGVEDVLLTLADEIKRLDIRDADTTVTPTVFQTFRSGVELSVSATLTTKQHASGAFAIGQSQLGGSDTLGGGVASTSSVSVDQSTVTAAALNDLRDLWQGAAATDQTHLGVGTDNTDPVVADNALLSAVDRVALEKFGEGNSATTVEYVATVPAGGIVAQSTLRELMPFDAATGGDGYLRLTFADVDLDASTRLKVHVEVSVSNDADEQGVVTTTGQQRLVDLYTGDTTAHEPSDMVYGTGTTAPDVSDTALGSKQHEDTIDSTADRSTGITDVVERITSGDANTTNFSEVGQENVANELLTRLVFNALSSDVVLETNHQFRASNA